MAAKSWSTLLTVALVAFAASGRSQSVSAPGKITGIVTDGATGAPLADVTVKLGLHQPGCEPCIALIDSPPNVLTGPDGKFEFVNVPPRDYEVVAAKPTYANGGFGISKAEDFPRGFSVASGATVSGLGIILNRNAVIGGRVTDENGAPVVGHIVSVMKRTANGELEPFRGDNVSRWARRLPLTDDQGRYFTYLPAGEYYAVVDVVREFDRLPFSSNGKEVTRNSAFVSQFFPASASFSGAKPINVQPGEVRDDVNFRLTRSPVVTVSGRVERPSASAPTDALTVRLRLDNLPDGLEARVGADGSSFEFPAVVAGEYELTVEFRESLLLASVARRPRITTSEFKTRFSVPTTDVRGLAVRMPPTPSVTQPPPSGQGARPMIGGADFGSLQVQVVDDRGAVVPNARVDVRYSDYPLAMAMGLSDEKGNTAFSAVPERSVTVSAEKDGYVKSTYGQRMIFDKGIQVVMAALETQRIRMQIERAALISGIVRNGQGEPVREVVVTVRRWTTESGRRVLKEVRSVLTGPDGRYRFHGLSSGTYVLTATQAPLWNEEAARRLGKEDSVLRREDWFATIPRIIDPNSSSGLKAGPGEQHGDVDISLAHRVMTTVNVEGRIELPKQFSIGPMTPTPRIVEYSDPFEVSAVDWANRSATLEADGRFRFRDVRPGKHLVHWSNSYGPSGEQQWWVMANIDTRRGSVSNLSLKPVRGARVSGRVVLQSRSLLPALNSLRVSLERHNDVNFVEPFIEDVGADGRFSFPSVPIGDYSIHEFSVNPPYRWRAESVMVNGVDALDFPFQARSGRDVSNAIVTLTDLPADVSGVALDSAGARASGAIVAMFASERRYWTVESRRVMLAQADSHGRFSFSKLAAGDYLIATVDDAPRFGDWDPQLLARLKPRGIPVKVVLGESKTIELRAR